MERSISNRFYFDYNATSPLSDRVKDFVHSGDSLFGNPASLHQTGKKSKRAIIEVSDYLFAYFNLDKVLYRLIFHSGATEGINTFFKGVALKHFEKKEKATFFFSTVDHACVYQHKEFLSLLGHDVFFFDVNQEGQFEREVLVAKILEAQKKSAKVYMNYTYMNNETGVIWPLEWASEIKKQTEVLVHVDAVQIVGKMADWQNLLNSLDAYTFSAHKFGALKGVGFTFVKDRVEFMPLIHGGSQQNSLRSGTENALGVYSIKLALSEFTDRYKKEESKKISEFLKREMLNFLAEKAELVASEAPFRNLNTFFFVFRGQKAETLSMKCDMMGIEVSTGSACSSGIIKENRILMSMGYSAEDSRAALRFSFGPFVTMDEAQIYIEKIKSVFR